jgi:hypothetical protein
LLCGEASFGDMHGGCGHLLTPRQEVRIDYCKSHAKAVFSFAEAS